MRYVEAMEAEVGKAAEWTEDEVEEEDAEEWCGAAPGTAVGVSRGFGSKERGLREAEEQEVFFNAEGLGFEEGREVRDTGLTVGSKCVWASGFPDLKGE